MQLIAYQRDTDKDWKAIGATEPFWGVLTRDEYKQKNLTPAALDQFYTTGDHDFQQCATFFQQKFGWFNPKSSLDFGCGAGRIAMAMAQRIPSVVGVDISEGMLTAAASRARSCNLRNLELFTELPQRKFDWVNSIIVLQHIPPSRGLAIIDQLLARVNPGGLVSLHVVLYKEQGNQVTNELLHDQTPKVLMYGYPLGDVMDLLNRHDVNEINFLSTNHGGECGGIIFGRKRTNLAGFMLSRVRKIGGRMGIRKRLGKLRRFVTKAA